MIDLTGKQIAVLMGGPGSERDVSLASGAGVAKALRSLGAAVTRIDVRDAHFELPNDTEIAFNVIHGTFGEDGQLQRILEDRGVAYTGEGVYRKAGWPSTKSLPRKNSANTAWPLRLGNHPGRAAAVAPPALRDQAAAPGLDRRYSNR